MAVYILSLRIFALHIEEHVLPLGIGPVVFLLIPFCRVKGNGFGVILGQRRLDTVHNEPGIGHCGVLRIRIGIIKLDLFPGFRNDGVYRRRSNSELCRKIFASRRF